MLSAKSDGKALALGDTVAGAEGAGEVAGGLRGQAHGQRHRANPDDHESFHSGALNI
jgi:hypothetical protein